MTKIQSFLLATSQPKRYVLFLVISALLFASLGQAKSNVSQSRSLAKFEFALIGDTPYQTADLWKLDNVIDEINAHKKLKWVLHAGDFKNGSSLCSDEMFEDRLMRFQRFRLPFIYTPGDNEWTDCHRANNGAYAPLERLERVRELFFPQPGVSLGQKTMMVETQANDPDHAEFVENMRWMKNRVVFATVHIVGSNNGLAMFSARTQADDDEAARRIQASIAWIRQSFDQARKANAVGIFFLFQANPEFDAAKGDPGRLGFEEILATFERESVLFGKPVIFAHGDSHYFRIDKPMRGTISRRRIENVTRVETFGSADYHWLRIEVDPTRPEVFTIHQQIVPDNLENHPLN